MTECFAHASKYMSEPIRNALLALFVFCAFQNCATALEPLPALKANASNVTVSGLSSGGFMAVQFHVAHSATVRGAGILAAGPYYCAQDMSLLAVSACMSPTVFFPVPALERLVEEVKAQAAQKNIDAPEQLAASRVWLFSGAKDSTVKTDVVDMTYDFYRTWLPASSILYERIPDAGHAMLNPEAKDANECYITAPPYINHCGNFDAPGHLLAYILGPLKPRVPLAPGEFLTFNQQEFAQDANSVGMDTRGYAYIPKGCRGGKCGVHIAFHGCEQQAEAIGEIYAREAGYNNWAENNRLVVLYPQTVKSPVNPHGCWDWWGYTGPNYHLRSAPQIKAVKAMLDRLTDTATTKRRR
ncbi:MAG: poly(3-hydroxybutyrate) depolymerase [Azoarcus sp.]|jgi:poly(3-hydroxybutyrate) depolymerase|nr:poly(3-hydroxybutyrate) depolymerase [Azoarcus sp.]